MRGQALDPQLVAPWVWLALALTAGAVAAFVAAIYGWGPGSEWVIDRWRAYETWANTKLRALYSPMRAKDFLLRHIGSVLGGLAFGVALGSWFFGVTMAVFCGYLPVLWLERQERNRRKAMEEQLDSTLQSLANTILVTQNLEDA